MIRPRTKWFSATYFLVVIFFPLTNLVDVATLLIAGDEKPDPELKVWTLEKPPFSIPGNNELVLKPDPPPKHKSPGFPNPNPAKGDIPKGEMWPPNGDIRGADNGNSCR